LFQHRKATTEKILRYNETMNPKVSQSGNGKQGKNCNNQNCADEKEVKKGVAKK